MRLICWAFVAGAVVVVGVYDAWSFCNWGCRLEKAFKCRWYGFGWSYEVYFGTVYFETIEIWCDAATCSKDSTGILDVLFKILFFSFTYNLLPINAKTILQVEYVIMEKQQEDAYKEAIEDYRAASRARMTKNSEINSTNILGVIPRRQISNYFVQFRKVLQPLFITFSICSIYLLQTIWILCLSLTQFLLCVFLFLFHFPSFYVLIPDCKSSFIG